MRHAGQGGLDWVPCTPWPAAAVIGPGGEAPPSSSGGNPVVAALLRGSARCGGDRWIRRVGHIFPIGGSVIPGGSVQPPLFMAGSARGVWSLEFGIPAFCAVVWRWRVASSVCRGCNLVERWFCRVKLFWRIATRYDKLASRFASVICLCSAVIWAAW